MYEDPTMPLLFGESSEDENDDAALVGDTYRDQDDEFSGSEGEPLV